MQATSTDFSTQGNQRETPAGIDARPAANGSCPQDCHYCSGPETD